jgi:hypothetical protein
MTGHERLALAASNAFSNFTPGNAASVGRTRSLGASTGAPIGASCGVAEGCRLMGIARSTFYDEPTAALDDTAIVEAI